MENEVQEKIQLWLDGPYDEQTKSVIKDLQQQGNYTELTDAFYKNLEFGTGGLRGLMGVGSNRMNIYTVGAATQGLANYLKKSFPAQEIKVAVANDSRNNSPLFAKTIASIFSANGIKVFLFPELRPTPQLSFTIRQLGCQSGVVVTASHNPKEYNGYKAYWNDGGQLIPPHDANVIKEVEAIASVADIKFDPIESNITMLGPDMDQQYIDYIKTLSISKEAIQRQKDVKIVYTSIHGTGITLVPKVLDQMGFTNVHIVNEQATPDGNFPTVVYPNPEEQEAMSIGLKMAKELDADLLMATDPDADRVGIGVKDNHGEFKLLNGNQTASILFYYMLEAWKSAGKITGKEMIVKTIVTTNLLDEMAADYGVACFNTLTGFKYIAGVMAEQEGKLKFICGGEESYGYLVGDQVRDKDAIVSCAMLAEMAAFARDKGLSLWDFLMSIYERYGFYREGLISLTKKGKSGADEIKAMMVELRANPPKSLAGSKIASILDYQSLIHTDVASGGKQTPLNFGEKSNVLQYMTEDGTKISARPSGTEPKIKFYFSVKESMPNASAYDEVSKKLDAKIQTIISEMMLA